MSRVSLTCAYEDSLAELGGISIMSWRVLLVLPTAGGRRVHISVGWAIDMRSQ